MEIEDVRTETEGSKHRTVTRIDLTKRGPGGLLGLFFGNEYDVSMFERGYGGLTYRVSFRARTQGGAERRAHEEADQYYAKWRQQIVSGIDPHLRA